MQIKNMNYGLAWNDLKDTLNKAITGDGYDGDCEDLKAFEGIMLLMAHWESKDRYQLTMEAS